MLRELNKDKANALVDGGLTVNQNKNLDECRLPLEFLTLSSYIFKNSMKVLLLLIFSLFHFGGIAQELPIRLLVGFPIPNEMFVDHRSYFGAEINCQTKRKLYVGASAGLVKYRVQDGGNTYHDDNQVSIRSIEIAGGFKFRLMKKVFQEWGLNTGLERITAHRIGASAMGIPFSYDYKNTYYLPQFGIHLKTYYLTSLGIAAGVGLNGFTDTDAGYIIPIAFVGYHLHLPERNSKSVKEKSR